MLWSVVLPVEYRKKAMIIETTYLASSSSSVLWMASVSYLVLHCATSAFPLDRARCSSALASCSSSNCSRRRSQSCLAACSAWARAFLDCRINRLHCYSQGWQTSLGHNKPQPTGPQQSKLSLSRLQKVQFLFLFVSECLATAEGGGKRTRKDILKVFLVQMEVRNTLNATRKPVSHVMSSPALRPNMF